MDTISSGIPAAFGIFNAPYFSEPNSDAPKNTPIGLLAPSNATAIPSNPIPDCVALIDEFIQALP